jgi:hypothetical protein
MISLLTIYLSIALSGSDVKKPLPKPYQPLEIQKAEDWQIEAARARAMVLYYESCRGNECLPYKKLTKNKTAKREIREANDIARINFRLKRIKARYSEEDEERYRRLRGIKEGEERGNVGGYATKILRVKTKKKRSPNI